MFTSKRIFLADTPVSLDIALTSISRLT